MKAGFIDWTGEELHLYISEKKGGRYNLVDTISTPFECELNQEVLSPLTRTNVEFIYLSLPADMLSIRELEFPFADRKKIKDTIAYELEGILLGSASNYSIDYIISGYLESGSKVMAICIEKTKLKEIIDTFSSAGIEPRVITSVDLRLSNGRSEKLLEHSPYKKEDRIENVLDELAKPSINLRQGEFAYKGEIEAFKKTFRLTSVLALILVLIFSTNTALRLTSLKDEYTQLSKEIMDIYLKTFPADKKNVDPVRQFRGNLNELMKKKTLFGGVSAIDILRNIADLKDKNIILYEFSGGEESILIKGTALSFEDVESFRDSLSSLFNDVRVMDSIASDNKKISFTIVMKERAI